MITLKVDATGTDESLFNIVIPVKKDSVGDMVEFGTWLSDNFKDIKDHYDNHTNIDHYTDPLSDI